MTNEIPILSNALFLAASDGMIGLTTVFIWISGAMLVLLGVVTTYVVAKRQTLSGAETFETDTLVQSGVPQRVHLLMLGLGYTVFVIYGSLVPVQFRPMAFADAVELFKNIPFRPVSVGSRADWVVNALLFIPLSFLWSGYILVDRRSRVLKALAVPLVVLSGMVLGIAVEFVQIWFPLRTVSQNDILAESIGAIAGAALWLVAGQTITNWLRSYSLLRRSNSQIDWLLQFWFLGLVFYTLMPLDLTIQPSELVEKFRAGRLVLIPFSEAEPALKTLFARVTDVVIFIPVGMLVTSAFTIDEKPLRAKPNSILLGMAVLFAFEIGQIFVYTRYASTTDLVTGTVGIVLGVEWMHRWRGGKLESSGTWLFAPNLQRTWLMLAAAGVYSLFLLVIFSAPFDTIDDRQLIAARFVSMLSSYPFASTYYGTEFNALSDVLRESLFFVPLGALLAFAMAPFQSKPVMRPVLYAAVLLYIATLATIIELCQIFLVRRTPDLTDIALSTIAGIIGMALTQRIVRAGPQTAASTVAR